MRVFARRQRVLQQTTQHAAISKPAPLARAEVRHKSSDAIILQLQRTIGIWAAQRLLLQRKIDFSSGEPTLLDPIPLVLGGTTNLGTTRPGMNGTVFPDGLMIKAYKEAVFNALQPQTYSFKQETKDERTGKVDASAYALSVFADVSAITKPNEKKKWSGGYPASILRGAPSRRREASGMREHPGLARDSKVPRVRISGEVVAARSAACEHIVET